jgi:hypothetical protein
MSEYRILTTKCQASPISGKMIEYFAKSLNGVMSVKSATKTLATNPGLKTCFGSLKLIIEKLHKITWGENSAGDIGKVPRRDTPLPGLFLRRQFFMFNTESQLVRELKVPFRPI